MKNKLIAIMFFMIFIITLVGCSDVDKDFKDRQARINKERFIPTGDIYKIGNFSYDVYYDKVYNIVYIQSSDIHSSGITPLIGPDKLPLTLEEYNKNK